MIQNARNAPRTSPRIVVWSSLVVVLVALGLGASCGSPSGPSAEELAGWAQALDIAGQQLDAAVADYRTLVVSVHRVATKNKKDLAAWDREWQKRQKAYEKKVKEVEAHNAAEDQKAADSAQPLPFWSQSHPDLMRDFDSTPMQPPSYPMTPRRRNPALGQGVDSSKATKILAYQPQYVAMPPEPKQPAKVKVRLKDEIRELKRIGGDVSTLSATLVALQVGGRFESARAELQSATTALEERLAAANKALKKAVKKDKKRGDVIGKKMAARVKSGGLDAAVAAARAALVRAVEASGLDLTLAWPAGDVSASPAPDSSPSAGETSASESPSANP